MKRISKVIPSFFFLILVCSGIACINQQAFISPAGYDFNKPTKYLMSEGLLEISGIAFYHGRPDSIYAEQDEDGRVYYFKLGDKKPSYTKFGPHGDYEDIAIMGEQVFLLRSDGALYTFPVKQVRTNNISDAHKVEDIVPAGEYEGLYADEKSQRLYILCKSCKGEKNTKLDKGFIFQTTPAGATNASGTFSINVKEIEALSGKSKINFRPSALTRNLKTNEWYILSSVNKALVITDANWKVKVVYALDPSIFVQPEGIAFDNHNNLYISNEGNELTAGTVLKFSYRR